MKTVCLAHALLIVLLPAGMISCSSLPKPGAAQAKSTVPLPDGLSLLQDAARTSGDAWQRSRKVSVSFEGEWSRVVPRLQPVLVDSRYRQMSDEVYEPRSSQMRQTHRGPGGVKTVVRDGRSVEVRYDGRVAEDPEVRAAAALVADGYSMFLFGAGWLLEKGSGWQTIGVEETDGRDCYLVQGLLRPGLGDASEDHVIAWVEQGTSRLVRVQFTLNGLESTRMADVDVSLSNHRRLPDGTEWPQRFVETIQRPVKLKAHEWRLTSIRVEPL